MPRTLSKGMTGQDVREVQDALNFHIRRLERLQVDGNFGPKTDSRAREFQKVNQLVADGLVGPRTRAMLFGFKHRKLSLGILPTASILALNPSGSAAPGTPPAQPTQLRFPNPFNIPRLQLKPFVLPPSRFTFLPTVQNQPTLLELLLRVPVRRDPGDSHVATCKSILKFVNDLDIHKKLGPFVVDKISDIEIDGVANPFLCPHEGGFDWGAKPVNVFSGDSLGLALDAEYTVKITRDEKAGSPNVVIGIWGEALGELKFQRNQGQSSPRLHLDGNLILGVKGNF